MRGHLSLVLVLGALFCLVGCWRLCFFLLFSWCFFVFVSGLGVTSFVCCVFLCCFVLGFGLSSINLPLKKK